VSGIDQFEFQRLNPKALVTVASNGVNCDEFNGFEKTPARERCFFIGSMDWWPNVEGLLWFLEDVWPLLRQRIPALTLSVIGRELSQELEKFRQGEGIQFYENVPDVRPHFYDNSILLVPLRIGGGTRIKILEAMAAGRPVVSTPLGAEGIASTHRKNILIAESPQQFLASIDELINNETFYQDIAKNARNLVEDQYDWKRTASLMLEAYQEALSTRRNPTA